jgi:hypothetical protein
MTIKRIAVLVAASLAAAANGGPWAFAQDPAPEAPRKICTCRAQGQDYELGALVCLRGPKGPLLARCATFLNNTSWQFTERTCVISMPRSTPTLRLTANHLRS